MILIAGLPDEPPVARALAAADELGIDTILLDARRLGDCRLELRLDRLAGWTGALCTPERRFALEDLSGVYLRLVSGPAASAAARNVQELWLAWCDIAPVRIASRPGAMLSNASKTFQSLAIRAAGFSIPETLVTNDPAEAEAFVDDARARGIDVIYKSVSGIRSIVQTFADADRARLGRIRWCPTQFQHKVQGTDYRVHTIGRQAFVTRITSDASDYRYAGRQTGVDAVLEPGSLACDIIDRCHAIADRLDLAFAGIDLRVADDGRVTCFEVNPCPAYSFYEAHSGIPIAAALVRWLEGLCD